MTKMIPPVPTSAVMMPTPKQKIGFSIESIVGGQQSVADATNTVGEHNHNNRNNHNNSPQQHQQHSTQNNHNNNSPNGLSSPPQTPPAATPVSAHQHLLGIGSTHLSPHLALQHPHPHMQHHQQQHPHHYHQLSPAQQHALHQHLLLQHHHQQQQQHQQLQLSSPKSNDGSNACSPPLPMRHDFQDIIQRLQNSAVSAQINSNGALAAPYCPNAQLRLSPASAGGDCSGGGGFKRERSPVPACIENSQNPPQRHQPPHTPPKSVSPQSSHPSSPPSALSLSGSPATPQQQQHQHQQHQQQQYGKPGSGPLLLPGMPPTGLVRPFPMGPGGPPQQGMPDIKALPPYINAPPEMPPQHNPHLIAAAQFQMAAAMQAGHVLGPAAAAAAAAGLPPHAAAQFMQNPAIPRDSYPLYPWLLSRHGRIFPHRFPGNFLLQPFRKPKRIRTAFSPSQLLKLEHAFESNQYVVGAERKALAQSLNLSETQVKVWFQNRRTKHKRMQQEDEKGGGSSDCNSHSNASCDEDEEDDDEVIDMEMDDCRSDMKHELDASH